MRKLTMLLFSLLAFVGVVRAQVETILPEGVGVSAFGTNGVTDGTNFYATLQAAVEAVAGQANSTLYCKPGADVGSLQHAPVTATLTVYGNGAYVSGGSERDFDLGNTDPNGGKDITADMTLTVKNLDGCSAWGTKATEHTVNVVFENCKNMYKVYISGTTSTLNISMTDCAFEGAYKEALYSNADGNITLTNVAFSNLNKAVNLNHKATGTQTVTINSCSFTNCGADVAQDQIPVRVLSSVHGGKSVLSVSDCTFSGTPEGGADILLDYGKGVTEAAVASTSANVVVEKENNVGTTTTVASDNSYEFTTAMPVAKVGETEFMTLVKAIEAVADGGTVTLIKDEVFTATNYSDNGGWRDGIAYSGDKSFTIDLDGHTVSQDGYLNDYLFWFKNVGTKENTITIKNGTLDAGTTAYCALCTASSHENKLTINTEDLNLVNNISNGSTVKIRANSVYNAKSGTKITGKNSYLGIENWNAIVNIYDGTEIYMNGTSSYNGCLVGVGGNGTINVYGGYGKGVKGGFIAMTSGGTINISGGEWIANTDGTIGDNSNLNVLTAQSNSNESGFAGGSYINVTGGTFRGGMDAWVLHNTPEEDAGLTISGGNFNVNPTRWVTGNSIVSEKDAIYTVAQPVAKIGETCYVDLASAFKAATSGCTIDILSDVTITEYWDARNTGAKFTVPVTINGNDKTIKFTNTVYDGGNYFAAFRFEADATVNNLTIDMSEAVSGFGGRFRAISSKGNLTVDGCTFIGNGADNNTRAIIFGEGAGTNASNLVISVVDSEFINWRRGISDNENAQDVKEVTVTGNTLTNAAVYVSATDNVTFTDNTVEGAYVDIRSYTENNELNVTATGNTLEENTEKDKDYNYIDAGGSVEEEGFKTPVAQIGKKNYALLAEAISAAHKATDKVTITLKKDITVAKSISINKLVTIDLNGKAISSAEGYVFEVTGGELVLQGEGSIGAICYIINDTDYKEADKTFALTENKINVDIVYNRTFGHTSWQVLYVPFAIPVENMGGFEVYSISDVTDSGVVIEQVVEGDLSANTPYIIKATEAGDKTINVTGATLSVPVAYEETIGSFTINGTYSSMDIDAESQYVLTNGLWCQLTEKAVTDGNNILGAFRVYLTAKGKNAPSEVRFVINNSDATAIDELKAENGNVKAEVYDLSGRRVEKAVKGIYVVNGKKVVK